MLIKVKFNLKKIKKKIDFFWFYFYKKFLTNKKYLDLGSDEKNLYFKTIDISPNADICFDITQRLPLKTLGKFDFIWSERLLEHLHFKKLKIVFENVYDLLNKGSVCRFSVPVCYYSPHGNNMMRINNQSKSKRMGHITRLTYKGYGEVSENLFGISSPPEELTIYWEDIIDKKKFNFRLIRYYDDAENLIINEKFFNEPKNEFNDNKKIKMKRRESFIFDLIKI